MGGFPACRMEFRVYGRGFLDFPLVFLRFLGFLDFRGILHAGKPPITVISCLRARNSWKAFGARHCLAFLVCMVRGLNRLSSKVCTGFHVICAIFFFIRHKYKSKSASVGNEASRGASSRLPAPLPSLRALQSTSTAPYWPYWRAASRKASKGTK